MDRGFDEIYDKKIDWKFISYLKDKFLFLEDIYPNLRIDVDSQVLAIGETDVFAGTTIYKDCISSYINTFAEFEDDPDKYDIVYRIMITEKDKNNSGYNWKEVGDVYYNSIKNNSILMSSVGPGDVMFIKKLKYDTTSKRSGMVRSN